MKKIVVVGILIVFATINCFTQGAVPHSKRHKPQEELNNTTVFARVYNMQGKKIAMGKILFISAESLQLYREEKTTIIPIIDIGIIRTKHSGGNNVLWCAAIGAVGGAIFAGLENSGKTIGADGAG
ncbi:hypothetical protein [Mangrovibacterium lignilyticum]|uniref:hypothetical protein n=1 Tax=Mangrovibacterium lignilyticum TaxID=2668052 RepID=UPI0013D40BBB|nr:hypothetical protein [Mangrovibacterium lignilyticum]